jgi:hypothetical protein
MQSQKGIQRKLTSMLLKEKEIKDILLINIMEMCI